MRMIWSSLQLCIMVQPRSNAIAGTQWLYRHRHVFQHRKDGKSVVVYYGYFEDFGIVYLS